ncbi:MAG: transcriptional repressor, partial [Candidatus Delongbacteria bacterium]|nr:transcriptional repressor [Candidatus Delongbacteria bacterium]
MLKSKRVRFTPQRYLVYKYLITKKNHPTAEKLYNDLVKNSESISLATVYNTLEIFERNGIVQAFNCKDDNFKCYD